MCKVWAGEEHLGVWLSCCDAGDVHLRLALGWDQGLGGFIKCLLEPKADKAA